MISFFKNYKLEPRTYNLIRGMTYVELIVVLSIFSVLSAVTIFNYKQFQLKVDIKNLSHEIILKIVEAQKSATSGKLAPLGQQPLNPATWKPSYGIHFQYDLPISTTFYSFIDLDYSSPPPAQNKQFVPTNQSCLVMQECLERVDITKGNHISQMKAIWLCDPPGPGCTPQQPTVITTTLDITFTRPNSGATFFVQTVPLEALGVLDHVEITVSSPAGDETATISIYPSGRIELN